MTSKTPQFLLLFALFVLSIAPAAAREAAFMTPGTLTSKGSGESVVRVDPKPDIEVGDSELNVTKRVSVFFSNSSNGAVKIENFVVNADANVTATLSANDCQKQGVIQPASRCSIEVSVTPAAPGNWSVEILMTHAGVGRIARAHLSGKTPDFVGNEKNIGLAVSSKEIKPVDFATVETGGGKAVRSTLLVNDSPEKVTIESIDLIEATNGLRLLDQGCKVGMDIPPASSCPATLVWEPRTGGAVSTDLIIRHTGKLGFAVIPVRGVASGAMKGESLSKDEKSLPLPPSPDEIAKAVGAKIGSVFASSLSVSKHHAPADLTLIGTVGARAVFLLSDGKTRIVSVGETFNAAGAAVSLLALSPRFATISEKAGKRTLPLESSPDVIEKALHSTSGMSGILAEEAEERSDSRKETR